MCVGNSRRLLLCYFAAREEVAATDRPKIEFNCEVLHDQIGNCDSSINFERSGAALLPLPFFQIEEYDYFRDRPYSIRENPASVHKSPLLTPFVLERHHSRLVEGPLF